MTYFFVFSLLYGRKKRLKTIFSDVRQVIFVMALNVVDSIDQMTRWPDVCWLKITCKTIRIDSFVFVGIDGFIVVGVLFAAGMLSCTVPVVGAISRCSVC